MVCLHFKISQNVNSTAQAGKNRVEFELTSALIAIQCTLPPSPRQHYGSYF